ncbi:MAG: glycosyltransferase family 2 protein [Chitinophagaceae bacterium]|nr:glycosyltransferase family 2 protein [Chitinophagaceae bacterium]
MPAPSCSLIVSTYNRPAALRRCAQSIIAQTVLPDEIIIADDGSDEETRLLIQSIQQKTNIPFLHAWQPHEGYQLAKIRNKAFVASGKEYLIQVDGDLILHPNFIKDHISMARHGIFVSGSRLNMDENLTENVIAGNIPFEDISKNRNNLSKKYNGWYSPLLCQMNYLIQRGNDNYKHVLGCNMAFWKKDLEEVNGYNENFKGWGKEDNDLAVRLINAGLQLRFVKYGAICYHMAHEIAGFSMTMGNEKLLKKSIKEKITFTPFGMKKTHVNAHEA